MAKLRIGSIDDAKPVTLTVKLNSGVHRDLVAYADAIKRERAACGPYLAYPSHAEAIHGNRSRVRKGATYDEDASRQGRITLLK